MAIKLNIRLFDDDLSVDPSPWNSSCSDFEGGASNFNSALENNEQVIAAMKEFLGSPMMEENLRPNIEALTNSTEDAETYFKSVNDWSRSVMDAFNQFNCTSAPQSINSSVSSQVMENVNEAFDGSRIGLRTAADASRFVGQVEEVVSKISSSLQETTSAAQAAQGSIPSIIHSAFSAAVEQNNENIQRTESLLNELIGQKVEDFRDKLQSWAESAASAASGGGN